jgi:hypothetical protein
MEYSGTKYLDDIFDNMTKALDNYEMFQSEDNYENLAEISEKYINNFYNLQQRIPMNQLRSINARINNIVKKNADEQAKVAHDKSGGRRRTKRKLRKVAKKSKKSRRYKKSKKSRKSKTSRRR